jgi:hypothetical protein
MEQSNENEKKMKLVKNFLMMFLSKIIQLENKKTNISLENEERMKIKFPKFHLQRIKWRSHCINAICWVFLFEQ